MAGFNSLTRDRAAPFRLIQALVEFFRPKPELRLFEHACVITGNLVKIEFAAY